MKFFKTIATVAPIVIPFGTESVMGASILDNPMIGFAQFGVMGGEVTGTKTIRRRELNEEMDTETAISGKAIIGISYGVGVTNDNTAYHTLVAYNITGLPRCTMNCNISIALSKSQECTKNTYDDASFVPLLDVLTYTTDEEGNTGVQRQTVSVDGENPTDESENRTQTEELTLSTFFYDEEGELVACSFLKPTISDEMKDEANNMLGLVGSMIADADAEINSTAPVAAADGGSSSSGTLLLSFLAVALSAACVLLNA